MSGQTAPPNSGTQQPPKSQNAPVGVRFTDVRKSAGITFVQDSTGTDEKYYLETMGTGVAWIDYDQDGLMDLYFVQAGATDAYKPSKPLRSALYHNNGDGTFTDVTEKAGVGGTVTTGKESRSVISTMMAIPICLSPDMGAPFCITTMATEPSPM